MSSDTAVEDKSFNAFDLVELEIDDEVVETPKIKYNPNAGKLLIDQLLRLENPKISKDIAEYLCEPGQLEYFLDLIVLSGASPEVCDCDDFWGLVAKKVQSPSENQEFKGAFKALGMITNPTVATRKMLQKLDERFICCIFRIFDRNSSGSLYHFRKLFVAGLNMCPNFISLLLKLTNSAGFSYVIILLANVIHPAIQDCILMLIMKSNQKRFREKMIEIEVCQHWFNLILNTEIPEVSIAAAITLTRLLSLVDGQEELVFLTIPLSADFTLISQLLDTCVSESILESIRVELVALVRGIVYAR
jgi:hypothetical protein